MHINKKIALITIISSCTIAIFTGITILQNLESVRCALAQHIQERMLHAACCDFQTEISECSLFPLSITCQNTRVVPATQEQVPAWHWECKKLIFYFSWLGLLFLNKLISTVEVTDLALYSQMDNHTLAISEHLQKILLGNILKLPMSFKALKITNGTLTVHAPRYNLTAQASFSALSKKNQQQFKSVVYLNNGTILYNNKPYLEHFNGTVYNLFVNKIQQTALIKASTFVRLLPEQKDLVYLTATYGNGAWKFHVHNQERELIANVIVDQKTADVTATLDSTLLCQAINLPAPSWAHDVIQATAHLDATGTNQQTTAQGTITAQKLPIQCKWNYDNGTITAALTNTQQHANLCVLKNSPIGVTLNTTLTYQQICALVPEQWQSIFDGDGAIHCTGTLGWPISQFTLTLEDCCITFEQSHNLCRRLHATILINQQTKTVYIKNMHGSLLQGSIDCPHARFDFDDHWQPLYAHAPIAIHHCLLNWNSNTSTCSGQVLLTYPQKAPHLDANITLESTYLASALIAQLQQHTESTSPQDAAPITTHIIVETQKPVHIDLPGLHAKAQANVTIDGTLARPIINGTLNLQKGAITFPSCTFTIISGAIHLDANQINNSLIELTAKTTIQQHMITLHVLGTIKNPDIRLSSIPTLTQQNIVALIIAGSPELSLNTALPALIAEQIKQLLITKTADNNSQSLFNKIIRQLSRVKLTPKLSDPTGTSGISGGIEVDFNDRLHAKIQQNFKASDSVDIELDYQLSDELSFRAFKDEQGQIGGQADMKFTW